MEAAAFSDLRSVEDKLRQPAMDMLFLFMGFPPPSVKRITTSQGQMCVGPITIAREAIMVASLIFDINFWLDLDPKPHLSKDAEHMRRRLN